LLCDGYFLRIFLYSVCVLHRLVICWAHADNSDMKSQ
jgi:hypothetical protein